jgi:hypothetical protein
MRTAIIGAHGAPYLSCTTRKGALASTGIPIDNPG